MDILYTLLVFPFEWILKTLLELIYQFIPSYGLSIIILSFCVNTLLLPLFYVAEKLQEKERAVQAAMRPKLEEYRAVFKGNELFFYTQNLYKQHNYHPIYAFRGLVGLLIQIPFFIAAYYYLSNMPELENVGFLFISDLSAPDKFLTFPAIDINILPFIMTLLSLAAAVIYGKKLPKSEKYSIYSLSFLFLFILYTAPSALLIYWTTNNLFSLLKNCIFILMNKKDTLAESTN